MNKPHLKSSGYTMFKRVLHPWALKAWKRRNPEEARKVETRHRKGNMQVRDLIEDLKRFDPSAEVQTLSETTEYFPSSQTSRQVISRSEVLEVRMESSRPTIVCS